MSQNIKYGLCASMIIAVDEDIEDSLQEIDYEYIGESTEEARINLKVEGEEFSWTIDELRRSWASTFESVFPLPAYKYKRKFEKRIFEEKRTINIQKRKASPKVCIPVFPGSNCEEDTAKTFERCGAKSNIFVFRNKSQEDIKESLRELEKNIRTSQIFVVIGGFSLGDQPDGSGKYIANILRQTLIKDAMQILLENDGLILGVCNGFQALIKSGWLPNGKPQAQEDQSATLSTNISGTHISHLVEVEVQRAESPWLSLWKEGDKMLLPVSHGEGRFVAEQGVLDNLYRNGQIATKYTSQLENPNASVDNIEGIISQDGKIYGRMGHAERISENLYKNIPNRELLYSSLLMFQAGVNSFQK